MNDEILNNLENHVDEVFDRFEKRIFASVAIAGQWVALNKENEREFDKLVEDYKRAPEQINVEHSFFSRVKRQKNPTGSPTQEAIVNVYFDYLTRKGITAEDLDRLDTGADFRRDT